MIIFQESFSFNLLVANWRLSPEFWSPNIFSTRHGDQNGRSLERCTCSHRPHSIACGSNKKSAVSFECWKVIRFALLCYTIGLNKKPAPVLHAIRIKTETNHYLRAGAHFQEPATLIISQYNCNFTNQSILRYFSHNIGQFQCTWECFGKDKTKQPHVNMSASFQH